MLPLFACHHQWLSNHGIFELLSVVACIHPPAVQQGYQQIQQSRSLEAASFPLRQQMSHLSLVRRTHTKVSIICDRICENPACRENAQVAQCAFLVPQVENGQCPVFVIFMSKNLSTNYCRSLRRVNISYQGEISLYLQAPRST